MVRTVGGEPPGERSAQSRCAAPPARVSCGASSRAWVTRAILRFVRRLTWTAGARVCSDVVAGAEARPARHGESLRCAAARRRAVAPSNASRWRAQLVLPRADVQNFGFFARAVVLRCGAGAGADSRCCSSGASLCIAQSPKKVGDDVQKATKDWKGLKVRRRGAV